jgi:hypothetical protein
MVSSLYTAGISAFDMPPGRYMPVDSLPASRTTNMSPRDGEADRIASAQQTLDGMLRFQFLFSCMHREPGSFKVLYDMSQLFGTQLDKETLATCIGMIESGVNPEALAVSV